jgi:4-hydroxybenzoate polyprenyltransferase
MKGVDRLYKVFNLLNLDVVVGAVISALYFAKLLAAKVNVFGILALGLTVWIIYTADRLLDVKKMSGTPTSERHKFHQKNYNILFFLLVIVTILVGISIPLLNERVIIGGLSLAVIIGLYLFLQRYLPLKEFFVAGLYTFGVLLPSWRLKVDLISGDHVLLIGQFFSVALVNLLLFSWFEFENDLQDGHSSMAIRWGKTLCAKLIIILGIISLCLSGWMIMHSPYIMATSIFLLMMAILMWMLFFHSYFIKNARYRLLGDAVFFLSLIGLFL